MDDLITIRSYHDAVLAQLIEKALKDAGINVFLKSSNVGLVTNDHLIQVLSEDVEFALEVIENHENF